MTSQINIIPNINQVTIHQPDPSDRNARIIRKKNYCSDQIVLPFDNILIKPKYRDNNIKEQSYRACVTTIWKITCNITGQRYITHTIYDSYYLILGRFYNRLNRWIKTKSKYEYLYVLEILIYGNYSFEKIAEINVDDSKKANIITFKYKRKFKCISIQRNRSPKKKYKNRSNEEIDELYLVKEKSIQKIKKIRVILNQYIINDICNIVIKYGII